MFGEDAYIFSWCVSCGVRCALAPKRALGTVDVKCQIPTPLATAQTIVTGLAWAAADQASRDCHHRLKSIAYVRERRARYPGIIIKLCASRVDKAKVRRNTGYVCAVDSPVRARTANETNIILYVFAFTTLQ